MAPGIGEKTEKNLWKSGITHWDHVEDSSSITDNKRDRMLNFLQKARKNLDVGNTHFFADKLPNREFWRSYRNFEENACFFDIETTGLNHMHDKVTTVSFYRKGESYTLVRDDDLTKENLEKEFFESSILVSFNGKMFDQPFLEKSFDMNIDTPHLDLMYPAKRVGLSGGLKKIEKILGVDRDLEEDIDGRQAIRLWKKYERDGDKDALRKLVKYNQYDAENLKDVADIVHDRLTNEFFSPYRS